jgi:hypothetical protein
MGPQFAAHLVPGSKAILVGLQTGTHAVEVLHVRPDGALSGPARLHRVPAGRTAVGEAITALGLTRLCRFPASSFENALQYARRLQAEMQDDAPRIL